MFKKKVLIIPDCHIPYHNERAYSLMLKVARVFKPDEVVLIGDFGDFYSISAHGAKNPSAEKMLKKEIKIVKEKLRDLEEFFPKAKLVYLEGNHEDRLSRYIADKAPELFNIVELKGLLELNEWEVIPYTPDQLYKVGGSKLYARHVPYTNGLHCAHGTVSKGLASITFGHIHRQNSASIVSASGKNYRGFCPGWLGNQNSFAFNYVKSHYQWTLGFSFVYTLKNGNFLHENIEIIENKCLYNGKIYE